MARVTGLFRNADVGFVAGGAGSSDSAARRPVYLDTKRGVVALVATASTFTPSSVAGASVEAKARANLVLFSIHAHETAGNDDEPPPIPFEPMVLHKADEAPSPNDPRPASFEVVLFHAAIDHGADIVIRHGPHVLGGIELYKGKPIFHSLKQPFSRLRR